MEIRNGASFKRAIRIEFGPVSSYLPKRLQSKKAITCSKVFFSNFVPMKFNHNAKMRHISTFFVLLYLAGSSWAQVPAPSRSGALVHKTAGTTAGVPCAGSQIFSEDFENGLPATWTVVDGDTLTPRSETTLNKGWQTIVDYADTTNTLMATPSWYVNAGQSDDWLISPQISLGTNSCLSWSARSLDAAFPESYEVRISTTNNDTAAFLQDTALVTVAGEIGTAEVRAVNLAAYANQDVYFAFRQTSEDKFVLLLDDVKVSNVNNNDIGVRAVSYGSPAPGDTVTFAVTVANYGSDTVRAFNILWEVDGGGTQNMSIDSIALAPNATLSFNHDARYISDSLDRFYDLCLWTRLPNNVSDEDISNDSLCTKLPIGTPVGIKGPQVATAEMQIFPNPFRETFEVAISGLENRIDATVRLTDLLGKVLWETQQRMQGSVRLTIAPGNLPAGMYMLQLSSQEQSLVTRRVLRH